MRRPAGPRLCRGDPASASFARAGAREPRPLHPSRSRRLFRLGVGEPGGDDGSDALLKAALERADTLWVALRPGASAENTDNVVVARGRFEAVSLWAPGKGTSWGPPMDLGGGLRRHDRAPPARRSAPARIYELSDRVLVFVSEAVIDSAERRIERRGTDSRVEPPEEGLVSFAARVSHLRERVREEFPTVAEVLSGMTHVEGYVTLQGDALRVTLVGHATSPERALLAHARAERLRLGAEAIGGTLGDIARDLELIREGPRVEGALTLDPEVALNLLAAALEPSPN
jgi:hypothetical protein